MVPVPQVVYGSVLQQVTALETELFVAPAETEVRTVSGARGHLMPRKFSICPTRCWKSAPITRPRSSACVAAMPRCGRWWRWSGSGGAAENPGRSPAPLGAGAQHEALERSQPPRPHAEAFPGTSEAERNVPVQ